MSSFIIQHQIIFRSLSFVIVLVLMLIWQHYKSLRSNVEPKAKRCFNNVLIVVFNSVLVWIIFPGSLVVIAFLSERYHIGLLHLIHWPFGLAGVLGIVILDFSIYWQHRIFHKIPLLWRVHRMHHTDLDLDTTTGIRFHPFEILLSLAYKSIVVFVFGISPVAVILFEILLNATALFNHANVKLPCKLDKTLRLLIVTPEMHQIHHSVRPSEANKNYGFNFSIWDRLFHSYRALPKGGQKELVIGITTIQDRATCTTIGGLLKTPFIKKIGHYPSAK
jgi:sterol desaturase/sphingolipid hydroxylase (fatty acid hydroxylase superfamily)